MRGADGSRKGNLMTFHLTSNWLSALEIVTVLLVACAIGYWIGSRKVGAPDTLRSLVSVIGAATLGLLGLLLAFTLSMVIDRWDARREVIINDANAIGTLWLRAGLLEEPLRGELRDALLEYTDARIVLSGSGGDRDAVRAARSKSEMLHDTIWSAVQRANRPGINPATLFSLITAANELIDIHELRHASIENMLPTRVSLVLLGVAAIALAFIAWSFGAASQRGYPAMLLLVLLISAILLLIMDFNRPQRGRIEVGFAALERVRDSMAVPRP